MEESEAWALLLVWFVFPIIYVCIDKNAGSWNAPKTSNCPFSPKIGWLFIVFFIGPIGLILLIYRNQKLKFKKITKK